MSTIRKLKSRWIAWLGAILASALTFVMVLPGMALAEEPKSDDDLSMNRMQVVFERFHEYDWDLDVTHVPVMVDRSKGQTARVSITTTPRARKWVELVGSGRIENLTNRYLHIYGQLTAVKVNGQYTGGYMDFEFFDDEEIIEPKQKSQHIKARGDYSPEQFPAEVEIVLQYYLTDDGVPVPEATRLAQGLNKEFLFTDTYGRPSKTNEVRANLKALLEPELEGIESWTPSNTSSETKIIEVPDGFYVEEGAGPTYQRDLTVKLADADMFLKPVTLMRDTIEWQGALDPEQPTEPQPTDPEQPTEPQPTDPAEPTQPQPTDPPEPTAPEPTAPKPTEPKPTEPKPTEPVTPSSGVVYRSGGDNRFQTAVAISRQFKPGVSDVYVATGMDYPDALAAAGAAGSKNAPVLLVGKNSVDPQVKAEVKRLRPKRIVIVGGTGVVSGSVEQQLRGLGVAGKVVRLDGANRYDTAAKVARDAFGTSKVNAVFVASGQDFPDALTASAAAGHLGGPVLLTMSGQLPAETSKALADLKPAKSYVVGGPGVISDSVKSRVGTAGKNKPVRLGGANRFQTAQRVANGAFGSKAKLTVVANGMNFPDALAGAALAGSRDGPVLLTLSDELPGETRQALTNPKPANVMVSGGPAVVSNQVKAQIAKATGLKNK